MRSRDADGETTLLCGWGRTSPSAATVRHPGSATDVASLLQEAPPRGVGPRGLGRSYGDLAQNGGGLVLDLTTLDRVHEFDRERGVVRVEAGCSLAGLLAVTLEHGWFLPVVPGTRYVTVGGAIACDVHGKNHHGAGSFGEHLLSLTLVTPDGRSLTLDPAATPEPFWATVGGVGLTGVIVEATLQLLRIDSQTMRVDVERTPDLETTLSRLRETDRLHRYSVAWVDGASTGAALGRAVLIQGDHAGPEEVDGGRTGGLRGSPLLDAPRWPSAGAVLRSPVMRILNEAQYRRVATGAGRPQRLDQFFFPLDAVGKWNRVYGRRGFLQYQYVVPHGGEQLIRETLEQAHAHGVRPTLVVLKRFGAASPAPLSFPRAGWTLALDFALPAPIAPMLDRLDERVVAAGGRVYLAKDSRLRPELLAAMYPRLEEWRATRAQLDPERRMQHDLGRRLGLAGE